MVVNGCFRCLVSDVSRNHFHCEEAMSLWMRTRTLSKWLSLPFKPKNHLCSHIVFRSAVDVILRKGYCRTRIPFGTCIEPYAEHTRPFYQLHACVHVAACMPRTNSLACVPCMLVCFCMACPHVCQCTLACEPVCVHGVPACVHRVPACMAMSAHMLARARVLTTYMR
jgi:hypothetical protein